MRRLNSAARWTLGSALGLALAAAGLFLVPLRAPGQDDTPTFSTDTNLVPLHVSVLDKKGKLVTDLPKSAFTVYEDNVEQQLKVFKREDVPVSMGILLDNSGSMRDKRSKVAAAALALVRASNPEDEVFIVDFSDDAYLDQPFTNDIKKLEAALDRLDTHGGTAMRNAISGAIDYLESDAKRDKRVLVVVTDGNDNSSAEVSQEQLMRKVQSTPDGVLIYTIGLLNEEDGGEARKAKRALKQLAEASGGFDFYPKDLDEVQEITPEIAKEIRNQYTLAYTPQNLTLDGQFRQIRVEVKGYGRVRAKMGYYAKTSVAPQPGSSFKNPK
jgi:Ca-activated chloride channel homolog